MTPVEAISKILDIQTKAIQDLQDRVKSLESSPANTSVAEAQERVYEEIEEVYKPNPESELGIKYTTKKEILPDETPGPELGPGLPAKVDQQKIVDEALVKKCGTCKVKPVEFISSGCCKDCHIPAKRKKRSSV